MAAPFPPAAWRERFAISGWALLPLRLFLGFTLLYAGLLKISDPNFFNAASSSSIQAQMRSSMLHSPLSFLQGEVLEHATAVGWLISLGEVAVGLSVLLGLWVRIGALGGALLSLSFLLTVSWGTTPYFVGPDSIYLMAFVPLILAGDGGVWSVGAAIRRRTAAPAAATPTKGGKRTAPSAEEVAAVDRRVLLRTGAVAAIAGVVALAVGLISRSLSGGSSNSASGNATAPTSSAGGRVAATSDVPVGGSFAFSAPDGTPAFLVQPKAGTYLAFSRVCTHEGCIVDFSTDHFACPCHGAEFSDTTGDPTRGPARTPLTKYNVKVAGSDIILV